MSSVRLKNGKTVSDFGVPYVIAEVNSSHNGNPETAKRMIDMAVESRCDCVKFQSWSSESLYSLAYYKQNPIARRFADKFSMSPETLKEMAAYCKEKGIAFSSTPYSREEADFLAEECDVPFIKVSSMEINNPEYLEYIAKKGLPVVLSTGMADYDEVAEAIHVFENAGNRDIVILHCVSVYPTPIDKVNLYNMLGLRQRFPCCPIGFSDHTLGDEAAVAATALGAAVLEKHITLDSSKIGMDNQMAMEPAQLKELVRKCHSVKECLGTQERILTPEEYGQRKHMRRSIVSAHDIAKGTVLRREDLAYKRPGTGIPPQEAGRVVGRRAAVDIGVDLLIREEYLEEMNQ